MWQQFLKEYFVFTKKERKGVMYLIVIILILVLLPWLFPYFTKEDKTDFSEFETAIALLQKDSSTKIDDNEYNDYAASYHYPSAKAANFYFDPNTASVNDWIRLGVKEKTARTILKYISKGGKFYKPEDIKKIWGISKADAERLMPYVSIKNTEKKYPFFDPEKNPGKNSYARNTSIEETDINTADTLQYIALPGIGSKLAKRIIAFREKLGGFYSVDQVAETYLLPDSTFQKIKPYLVLNNKTIKKININSASADEMKLHPYIRYNMANAIVQYRNQHGSFKSVDDIKQIMTVTPDFYERVSPYLTVE